MASVHELIAAAEAEKSPFVTMLEGAFGGYMNARAQAPQQELIRLQQEQARQNIEYQKMLRTATEEMLKRGMAEAGPDDGGATPQQKFDTVLNLGKHGASIRQVPTREPRTAGKKSVQYTDRDGKTRIGAFDPGTGQVLMSDKDAYAPERGKKTTTAPVDKPINTLSINEKADKMARDMYVQRHPDKIELDPVSNRISHYKLTDDDRFSDEYQQLVKQARNYLGGPAALGETAKPVSPPATNKQQTPEDYLRAKGAKITPANIEWAKKKMAGGN